MHKKRVKHTHKMSTTQTHSPKTIEDKLVENLVALQKVHTDMAEKFDKLSNQISNLLGLFEISARTIASNPVMGVTEKDREFLEKIDKLLDQNKLIAKGLTLMEEKMRSRMSGTQQRTTSESYTQSNAPGSHPELTNDGNQAEDEFQPMTPSIKAPDAPRPLPKY